jgi:hypothetical protein
VNRAETMLVLIKIASIDNRRLDPPDADVTNPMATPVLSTWHELLADLRVEDAMEAVANHRRASNEWLTPHHVIAGVKAIRAARLEAMPPLAELMAGVDPNMPGHRYAAIYRERIAHFADGGTREEFAAITGAAPQAAVTGGVR